MHNRPSAREYDDQPVALPISPSPWINLVILSVATTVRTTIRVGLGWPAAFYLGVRELVPAVRREATFFEGRSLRGGLGLHGVDGLGDRALLGKELDGEGFPVEYACLAKSRPCARILSRASLLTRRTATVGKIPYTPAQWVYQQWLPSRARPASRRPSPPGGKEVIFQEWLDLPLGVASLATDAAHGRADARTSALHRRFAREFAPVTWRRNKRYRDGGSARPACISRMIVPEASRNWTRNCTVNVREDDRSRRPRPGPHSRMAMAAADRVSSASGSRYRGRPRGRRALPRSAHPAPVLGRAALLRPASGQDHVTRASASF